jgi:hypothetical protein
VRRPRPRQPSGDNFRPLIDGIGRAEHGEFRAERPSEVDSQRLRQRAGEPSEASCRAPPPRSTSSRTTPGWLPLKASTRGRYGSAPSPPYGASCWVPRFHRPKRPDRLRGWSRALRPAACCNGLTGIWLILDARSRHARLRRAAHGRALRRQSRLPRQPASQDQRASCTATRRSCSSSSTYTADARARYRRQGASPLTSSRASLCSPRATEREA